MNQTKLTVKKIVSTLKLFTSQERQEFLKAIADFDELWKEILDVSGTLSIKSQLSRNNSRWLYPLAARPINI
jgi:hypothetical protein